MRILIAEDDMVSRNFLSKLLSKYGDIDLVVDGLETIDAFLIALKDKEPYQLICLDIMIPKVDGVKALKAIRDLEKQYEVPQDKRVKIIMITALAEAPLVRTVFDYGCEAYAAKPIDTKKFIEVMEKLGLIPKIQEGKAPSKPNRQKIDTPAVLVKKETEYKGNGYFRSVRILPDYQMEVTMGTGSTIFFDFHSRLNTARFGKLKDEELFKSAYTDGNYLIFTKIGKMPVKITASEFMDLVLIDRTRQ